MELFSDEITKRILDSPAWKKATTSAYADLTKERQLEIDRKAAIQTDAAERMPSLIKKRDADGEKARAAEEAREAARKNHSKSSAEVTALSEATDRAVNVCDNNLKNTIPAESAQLIAAFILDMDNLEAIACKYRGKVENRPTGKYDNYARKWLVERFSDQRSADAKLVRIRAVRLIARDQVPLIADVSTTNITAVLADLRASIPTELALEYVGDAWVTNPDATEAARQ